MRAELCKERKKRAAGSELVVGDVVIAPGPCQCKGEQMPSSRDFTPSWSAQGVVGQKPRAAEVEGAPGGGLGQPSCPERGHLELAAQDHIPLGSEGLRGWRLRNLSGQPAPCVQQPSL